MVPTLVQHCWRLSIYAVPSSQGATFGEREERGTSQQFCFIHAENKILNVHMEKAGGSWMGTSEMPVSGPVGETDLGII